MYFTYSFSFLFLKKIYYDWFTLFCQFLLYRKVTQSCIYVYICICIYTYIYTHSFSHIILHHVLLQVIRYIVPWLDIEILYSRISLPIHSKCKNFYLLTTDSQSIPLPPHPPSKNQSVLHVHDLFSSFDRSFVPYFRLHI